MSTYKIVTWRTLEVYYFKLQPNGSTIREAAAAGNWDPRDVGDLTRLMRKAGILEKLSPPSRIPGQTGTIGAVHRYVPEKLRRF